MTSLGTAACGASDAKSFADSSSAPTSAQTGAAGAASGGHAGSVGAGGGAAGAGGAGMAGAAVTPFAPTGSLDLVVTKVDVSQAMGPTAKTAPSMGARLRIDLPADFKTQKPVATVTPRWGEPSTFAASISDTAIVLTGSATIKTDEASDVWQTITIALGPGGKATGAISASGQESVFSAGVGYSGKIAAVGALGPDITAPEAKPGSAPTFGDAPLPWEAVGVTFAEPIADADAAAHVAVTDENANPAPFTFAFAPDAPIGAVHGLAYATDWTGLGSAVTVHVAPGYLDGAGNVGAGFDQGVSLVTPTKGYLAAQGFDGDAPIASWGQVEKIVDPICETGGCVVIGPFANQHCGVSPMGFAVRLDAPAVATSKVRVRYRLLYAPNGGPQAGALVPLSVQLARPGVAPTVHELSKGPAVADLGPTAGDFSVATAWTTLEVALPQGVSAKDEIGLAIRAGAQGASAPCAADSPPEPSALTKIVVDWVSATP